MRIALSHLRHAASGGTERYLNQLAAHLAQAGHEVAIVCRTHAEPPHPAVRFVVLRDFAIGGAWRLQAFARAVERHVARERYDVVYGLGRTWSQDLLRLGGGAHATYLERAHAETLEPWERLVGAGALKHRAILRIEARALAPGACWRVVCNARMVKEDIVARHGLAPDAVEVIYNGVDVERFHPRLRQDRGAKLRAELGFSPKDVVVLFLGTGYGRKGLGELLDAFPALAQARANARLMVVGRDANERRYRQRAETLGFGERARFLGGRGDAEACFAAADLYVLPTRYDPFANSTLEALASGLSVITTDANGGSELITDGVEGTILREGRARDAIERALVEWTDPDHLRHASIAARALAEQHTHVRAMRESADLIERCAATSRSGPNRSASSGRR